MPWCAGAFLLLTASELCCLGSALLLIMAMFPVVMCLLTCFEHVDRFPWPKLFLRLRLIVLRSSMLG